MHFGNKKILDATLKKCEEYTNEILIAEIDLLNRVPYGDYIFPWDFIYKYGYSDVWNFLFSKSPNLFMYILGTGKEIIQINNSRFIPEYDLFACVNPKHPTMKWYKVGNVDKCRWDGKIHESILTDNLQIQKKDTFVWDYFEHKHKVNKYAFVYRWFCNIKWLYHIQILEIDRENVASGWWTKDELRIPFIYYYFYLKNKHIMESQDTFIENAPAIYSQLINNNYRL